MDNNQQQNQPQETSGVIQTPPTAKQQAEMQAYFEKSRADQSSPSARNVVMPDGDVTRTVLSPEQQERALLAFRDLLSQGTPMADFNKPLSKLDLKIDEVGAYNNEPKSQASGRHRANPFVEPAIKITSHGERRARDRSLRNVGDYLRDQRRGLVPNPVYSTPEELLEMQPTNRHAAIKAMGETEVRATNLAYDNRAKMPPSSRREPLSKWVRIKNAVAAAFRKIFGSF